LTGSWRTVAAGSLADSLAAWLATSPGVTRVAIDGPPWAAPEQLAGQLVEPLRALGRPVVPVPASSFWHDASLRLEHGREDVASYLSWLDADALRREVLDAALERGTYLPSLRDPVSNRSTREPVRDLAPGTVLIISGALLLGHGLPFDRVVHLEVSAAAHARQAPRDQAWTLPAYAEYERTVRPGELADVVIRPERRNPAVRGLACSR
jgi:hypothetical protein